MKIGDGTVVRFTLSCVALVTSITAACCFLTVWSYWYSELDVDCGDKHDCKCLLFGLSFAGGQFVGGERSVCRYVFYSTLTSAGLAASMAIYYGCRLLLCPVSRRQPDHRPVTSSIAPPSSQINGTKIIFAILLAAMAFNMLIASIILNYGYIATCQQYVHQVKRFLMVSGNMVEMVSNRMSCGTIYDFLDYLQPPSRQVTYELIHRHKTNPRDSVINTSILLIISIFMSWFNTTVWIIFTFSVYYFK